jgi:CheY-like chemotaxis protein
MNRHAPRVLVVDDEEDICRNLSDILGDLGCRVETAYDGVSALEKVRRTPFDVALLDLRMPGMDGLTLCRELKALRSGTVAIIVTAYAGTMTEQEAHAAGAWQVVPKPVDLDALLKLVDEAAGQPMVLVVDDDRDLCASLRDLFGERGYRVCVAHDPVEASRRLGEEAFRVVLIDMRLPGGSGEDVFRTVRAVNPGARTVLITGFRAETDQLVDRVLKEGADAVCYKPFDVPNLLDAVRELAGSTRHEPAGPPGTAAGGGRAT